MSTERFRSRILKDVIEGISKTERQQRYRSPEFDTNTCQKRTLKTQKEEAEIWRGRATEVM